MAKRELLLILGFGVLGLILYQLTAPPRPDSERFSFARLVNRIRREVADQRERAEVRSVADHLLPDNVRELRVRGVTQVTVVGEDRADLQSELVVSSTGLDTADAERWAKATTIEVDHTGEVLTLKLEFPREGRQTAALSLKTPRTLRLRFDQSRNVQARDLAGVYLASTRGDATLSGIAGAVEGEHRGGSVRIAKAGRVRLTVRSSDVVLEGVAADATLDVNGGDLRVEGVAGRLRIDSRSTDLTVVGPGGPLEVTAAGGRAVVRAVRHEVRLDGRRTDCSLALAAPAAVTAFALGGSLEFIEPPSAGYTLDALAREGVIHLARGDIQVEVAESSQRVAGAIAGGGPPVTLRTTEADITIRPARSGT